MNKRTGLVFDQAYLQHELERGHPESPMRLQFIMESLDQTGLLQKLSLIKIDATSEIVADAILRVHTLDHYKSVKSCGKSGVAAFKAVEGVLAAIDAVCRGNLDNAFCAVRPPGHHVHNDLHKDGYCKGEGFCFLNNVAIAARYAQAAFGYKHVLIVDWDYHHGNGTEDVFYGDPSVLYFSTHRLHAYPHTGFPGRTGDGPGAGYNINYPLPSPQNPYGQVTDKEFLAAFELGLIPALKKTGFAPDLFLISAGFDGRFGDTLGDFSITDEGFVEATNKLMNLAETYCSGRIISVLEGGYDVIGLSKSVCAHIAALAGA